MTYYRFTYIILFYIVEYNIKRIEDPQGKLRPKEVVRVDDNGDTRTTIFERDIAGRPITKIVVEHTKQPIGPKKLTRKLITYFGSATYTTPQGDERNRQSPLRTIEEEYYPDTNELKLHTVTDYDLETRRKSHMFTKKLVRAESDVEVAKEIHTTSYYEAGKLVNLVEKSKQYGSKSWTTRRERRTNPQTGNVQQQSYREYDQATSVATYLSDSYYDENGYIVAENEEHIDPETQKTTRKFDSQTSYTIDDDKRVTSSTKKTVEIDHIAGTTFIIVEYYSYEPDGIPRKYVRQVIQEDRDKNVVRQDKVIEYYEGNETTRVVKVVADPATGNQKIIVRQ